MSMVHGDGHGHARPVRGVYWGVYTRSCSSLLAGKPKTITAAQAARNRLQVENEKSHAVMREESDRRLEKHVMAHAMEVPKATDAELAELGALFVKQLAKISSGMPRAARSLWNLPSSLLQSLL